MPGILLAGIFGRMGGAVVEQCAEDCERGFRVCAGLGRENGFCGEIPVFGSTAECGINADIVVDFSGPGLTDEIAYYCREHRLPLVIGTTGHSQAQTDSIVKLGETVAVFYSANMSVGVNLLAAMAAKAAQSLGYGYDIEIIDRHHRNKLDAPSGTSFLIANTINDAPECNYSVCTDAGAASAFPRNRGQINIHSMRYGSMPGEHDVVFAGNDEVITLSHSALSRRVFASGALKAAAFVLGQKRGLFSMLDLVR